MPEPADELLANTWVCKLPVRVEVAASSISSPVALPPFYFLVSRQSYLSAISSALWPLIQHVLPKLPGNVQPKPWFDYKGTPLKSVFPVGVLYDLFSTQLDTAGTPGPLPWCLCVHYTHAPPESSASWLSSLPPQTLFMNSLKEACHVCKGTEGSAAVMRMDGKLQDTLWSSVERCDVSQYASALATLKVTPSARSLGSVQPAIPVRIILRQAHTPQSDTDTGPSASQSSVSNVWDHIPCSSRPVPALSPKGAYTSLGDVLHALLPALFTHTGPATACPPDEPTNPPTDTNNPVATSTPTTTTTTQHASDPSITPNTSTPLPPADTQPAEQYPGDSEAIDSTKAGTAGSGADGVGHREAPVHGDASGESTVLDAQSGAARGEAAMADMAQSVADVSGRGVGDVSTQPVTLPLATGCVSRPVGEGGDQAACRWLVCGVTPPLDTPLAWLHAHMHAPDYFLYIVVRADMPVQNTPS